MAHRIREAMHDGKLPGSIGGQNKVVEIDETFVGGKPETAKITFQRKPLSYR